VRAGRPCRAKAAEAAAAARKRDKSYRLVVAETDTVVVGDWSKPDDGYYGLSLADVARVLEA
jgi:hypothetical protein